MLTLFAEKSGKVRVIAKGARKITSKLVGYTELFTLISCQIDFRSSIPIVSQITHERLFDGIATNQHLYQQLHVLAELIDKGTQEQESQPSLFDTVARGVYSLVSTPHPLMLGWQMYRISRLLGFAPQLQMCAHCDLPLDVDQSFAWSDSHGGIVSCPEAVAQSVSLSLDEAKVLRFLSKCQQRDLEKLRTPAEVAARIERLLLSHIQFSLEQDFVTRKSIGSLSYAHLD